MPTFMAKNTAPAAAIASTLGAPRRGATSVASTPAAAGAMAVIMAGRSRRFSTERRRS